MSHDASAPCAAHAHNHDAAVAEFTLVGHAGAVVGTAWRIPAPRFLTVICHGYGEHVRRYGWVAQQLNVAGASVYGADHRGHGRSEGERALIPDFEPVVADLDLVVDLAARENPGVPIVLLGHSMGGMIAARYCQLHADRLVATVLSGPAIGRWDTAEQLLAAEEIPSTPIDPAVLSRDPEVGKAYEADPLVYHGDFQRPTLQGLHDEIERINRSGSIGALPLLHLHGEDDRLVPIDGALEGADSLSGSATGTKSYPGARHEILNETNRDEVITDILEFADGVLARIGR